MNNVYLVFTLKLILLAILDNTYRIIAANKKKKAVDINITVKIVNPSGSLPKEL